MKGNGGMCEVFTVEQVAARLSLCKRTVRELITSHELKHVKIGRVYRVTEKQLEEFLKKRSIGENR